MCLEWIKYISPLIGVGIGAILVPWIENKKANIAAKTSIENFFSEVEEWYLELDSLAKDTFETYKKAQRIESGETISDENLYPIILGKDIQFLTMEIMLEKAFIDLSFDQRKAIRAITALKESINLKLAHARTLDIKSDPVSVKGKAGFMTRELASLYYILSRLHHEQDRFKYLGFSNDEMREKGLDALNIKL